MTVFSGAGETIGFDKNPLSRFFTHRIPHVISAAVEPGRIPQGPTVHEVQRNQALIASFTDDQPARPRLYPTAGDIQKVAGYKDRPYITISPASVWFTKQYPGERWAGFIRGLPGGTKVFLLGAPGDRGLCENIIAMAGNAGVANELAVRGSTAAVRIVSLAGELSFLQSAALMRDAVMNYVNDSAPMHFASALNAPVTAVYCSTIPGFGFGPLSDRSFIVEVETPLACRPCGLHGYKACPQGHFNCAHQIQDRQLLETVTLEKL